MTEREAGVNQLIQYMLEHLIMDFEGELTLTEVAAGAWTARAS